MGDGYRDENGEFCSIYMILFCFVLIMRNGSGRLGHAIVHIYRWDSGLIVKLAKMTLHTVLLSLYVLYVNFVSCLLL